ncbi:MAG: sodium:alanine symporter family protein [Ruminococcus sp.]|nr:sodium:alanine symporter family protein [Oscillospiraceae bacterium]MDY4414125.1 sodium:alanine symporter family protein [Ruminococcus sp.]
MELVIEKISEFLWGIPVIILILGCGMFLTVRLKGIQIRKLGLALKYMLKNEKGGDGDVSSFGALCTALSATIGTGNIVGVATAIAIGGPGALFWMEFAALFGMATKYTEGFLAIKYRVTDSEGTKLGGPFYYIENGMGKKYRPLAKMFAFFGVFVGLMGIGTFTQINGIASATNNFFHGKSGTVISIFGHQYSVVTIITGLVITLFAGLVIIGGIKNISGVSQVIVPFMAIIYIICTLIIVFTHIEKIPYAVSQIIGGAFGIKPLEGATVGGTIMIAMQKGVARGIFSNEAGLGSAPIASAAAKTKNPVRQGLVTMTATFIDTICVCTMTGFAIIISGAWQNKNLEGVEITSEAFKYGLPFPERMSEFILMACLVFFAFTTILGWSYYSERCLSYLLGKYSSAKSTLIFRIIYICAVFIGPYLTVSAVWNIADIFNALMAIPNVIALIYLSGITAKETLK